MFEFLLAPIMSFAQEVQPVVEPQISQITDLIKSMNGKEGMSSLISIAVFVQIVMLFINSKYSNLAGKYRLTIMYGLNAVSGVLALKAQGLDLLTALTHANTMAAYQVLLNQVYKQWLKKED